MNRPSQHHDSNLHPIEPILALLHARARQRRHTVEEMAKRLGVTYRRFAQWQAGDASLKTARPAVLKSIAQYLGMPRVVVMAFVGLLTLDDFERPATIARDLYLHQEIERMRLDPVVGPFVPHVMTDITVELQAFILFLYREGGRRDALNRAQWFNELQMTVAVAASAQTDRP